jgi:SAM-dependent methyltransferase
VDITQEMLRLAELKGVYRHLQYGDVAATDLPSSSYNLCTLVLADEHLADLTSVYQEAARLIVSGGYFVLIGYHPFFLMNGMPTHYHRSDGRAVTIQSYVHLFSEHYRAGSYAQLTLIEFQEQVIDEDWLVNKPKWQEYLYWPISFALVWRHN